MKLIKGIMSFLIGAYLVAYSFETVTESVFFGYAGLVLMAVGGILLLQDNCDRHDVSETFVNYLNKEK